MLLRKIEYELEVFFKISYYPIYATMFIANNTLPPDLIYKI